MPQDGPKAEASFSGRLGRDGGPQQCRVRAAKPASTGLQCVFCRTGELYREFAYLQSPDGTAVQKGLTTTRMTMNTMRTAGTSFQTR